VGTEGAIAVDTLHGHIYWTNLPTNTLNRANLDGSNQVSIAKIVDLSLGVAIYSEEDKVYFTTYYSGTVEVVNADGTGRTKLYEDKSSRLICIAIDKRQR
ncbi:hypothetical protein NP493_1913g00029, partial [Ridgeia piscesae]